MSNRNAWDYLVANAHFRRHGGDRPEYRPADYQASRDDDFDKGEILDGDADLTQPTQISPSHAINI